MRAEPLQAGVNSGNLRAVLQLACAISGILQGGFFFHPGEQGLSRGARFQKNPFGAASFALEKLQDGYKRAPQNFRARRKRI
jgi:hypothetical protein